MNINDVNKLLAQGFTPDFIMRLDGASVTVQNDAGETKNETETEPVQITNVTQEDPAPAQEAPVKVVPPVENGSELDRLFSELRNLTNAIQAQNRLSADMGANIIDPQTAGHNALAGIGGLPVNTNI